MAHNAQLTKPTDLPDQPWTDRRRASRAGAEALLELSRFLPPPDRALMEAFLIHGQSAASLARLAGRPRLAIRRRIRGLIRRMSGAEYRSAARHLHRLSPAERDWAESWVFAGRSLRELSAARGVSLYILRGTLRRLQGKLARLDGRDRP